MRTMRSKLIQLIEKAEDHQVARLLSVAMPEERVTARLYGERTATFYKGKMVSTFSFKMTADPNSLDVLRNDQVIGKIQRHSDQEPRLVTKEGFLSFSELKQIMEKFDQFVIRYEKPAFHAAPIPTLPVRQPIGNKT